MPWPALSAWMGYDVKFLTGTDEHGIKMSQTAAAKGITPKELADENSAQFLRLADALNLSNDDFIRTTEERHKTASQAIWQRMQDKGDIYEDIYAGWYSVRDEAYYDESELVDGEGDEKLSPQGTPRGMGGGKKLLFPPVGLWRQIARLFRQAPRIHRPESPPQ